MHPDDSLQTLLPLYTQTELQKILTKIFHILTNLFYTIVYTTKETSVMLRYLNILLYKIDKNIIENIIISATSIYLNVSM